MLQLRYFCLSKYAWRYLDRIIRENWSPILYRRQAKVAAIAIYSGLEEFAKIVHNRSSKLKCFMGGGYMYKQN